MTESEGAFVLAPPHWRDETSGLLAPVIEVWVTEKRELTTDERIIFAAYLELWANFVGFKFQDSSPEYDSLLQRLQRRFDAMVTNGNRETIGQWLQLALRLGIDPL